MFFPQAGVRSGFDSTWEAGDRRFGRGWLMQDDGRKVPVLGVWPAGKHCTPAALDRLAHEYALRDDLDATWAARPLSLLCERDTAVLLLDDPGGEPLAQLVGGPIDPATFLDIAVAVTMAVSHLHQRGLVHKDLKPAHVLVSPDRRQVWLLGFGMASRVQRSAQPRADISEIAGTLAYMSPEQTGRMNRAIDARSDLYALGVTFYQLLTGVLPFVASDPLDWIHAHLARTPCPPAERNPAVPAMLSALVMKLLAKAPEERYQTAAGLVRDLQHCRRALLAHGQIAAFALGQRDLSGAWVIPDRLYGREFAMATLLAAYERVACTGRSEIVMVSGHSGVGKTSLLRMFGGAVAGRGGVHAAGNSDAPVDVATDAAVDAGIRLPYAALTRAVSGLLRLGLADHAADMAPWRTVIAEALGPNAGALAPLLPELRTLLGPVPWMRDTPSRETGAQVQLALRNLVAALARTARPLTLCLDDIQWLDDESVTLLHQMLTDPGTADLLVVCAYRSHEVGDDQGVMQCADALRADGAAVTQVELGCLDESDLRQLVADALHCDTETATPLARLVMEKTAGNAFFATRFISELSEEGLLHFDHGAARWTWDLGQIAAKALTDNVVSLMVRRIDRLPASTRSTLALLACLGNDTTVDTLARGWTGDADELEPAVREAERTGLVSCRENVLRFSHDRILEAAYSRIAEPTRQAFHLRVGRLLLERTPSDELDANVFTIVGQLNRATDNIVGQDERDRLAELNLAAALRAKSACANTAALHYLSIGLALLGDHGFSRHEALAFELTLHMAECEFLTGKSARAEHRLAALAARTSSITALALLTQLQLGLLMTGGRRAEAVTVGLAYLQRAGVEWASHPNATALEHEEALFARQLGDREIAELASLPPMTDAGALATMRVLVALVQPAWYTDDHLRRLVILRMVNLSVSHGNSDESALAYAWVAMLQVAAPTGESAGVAFERLSVEVAERRGMDRIRARVYQVVGGNLLHWSKPLRVARGLLRQALELTQQIGDLTYAAYIRSSLMTHALAIGDPLGTVQRDADSGSVFVWGPRFTLLADRLAPQRQLVRTLRGLTPVFGRFDAKDFSEASFEDRLRGDVGMLLVSCWYWIRKLQARYLAGAPAEALDAAAQAHPLLWTSPAYFEQAEYHFYAALARAACCNPAVEGELAGHLPALAGHHWQLAQWARRCPATFAHRATLVQAEIARLEGRDIDAMRGYESAIALAREGDLIHMQALANELAARFYLDRQLDNVAMVYLRQARHGYTRWGADAKVWQLDMQYPALAAEAGATLASTSSMGTIGAPLQHLDLATVIAISDAISGETGLERLLATLIRTAIEQAGATRGLLILPEGAEHRVEAEAAVRDETVMVTLSVRPLDAADMPMAMIEQVLDSREHVVINDGCANGAFSADPFVCQRRARSMLCLPLLNQGRMAGVLYLENALAPGVFVPARIEVIKLLAFQAASAIENSRLSEHRRRTDESLRQAQAELAHASRVMTLNALTASIAHEVSQPIAALTIEARAALRWLDRKQPEVEQAVAALGAIVEQGARAGSVIAGMRSMLRKTGPQAQRINLNEMITETLPLFASELERTQVNLKTELVPSLPLVCADKIQLQQVLLNLVMNAVEAMREILEHSRELMVRTAVSPTREVVVTVHDVGVGLPGDTEQVFQPFYTTKAEGLGMGLSICRSIIEAHGGRLHAWPNRPRGAVFGFALMAAETASEEGCQVWSS
ncbi:putative serine/threonine kinase with signal transduction histidinekinase and gaf sensor [Cupriavidus taiwanensis]|nr:putative serine/threonine kinase with signal transduction histidinekinase and gaf sensor [Cupriavidus taiwanensis]SOY94844.1 putative serine/threonine kinase with signal transduction histidinekinase and gaf sensor [Cupriavidus taiwanensis]SOZ71795.1 putative serine/threonine kinase with signal transduction histidinekinase and gaf sensor [Cupriavidus taiwanensis]SOZ87093.1 putative serine/threonine kinase with signal transduction histidinekinase and gaf sensor [Cupriavidus taiwanensis]SOZ9009